MINLQLQWVDFLLQINYDVPLFYWRKVHEENSTIYSFSQSKRNRWLSYKYFESTKFNRSLFLVLMNESPACTTFQNKIQFGLYVF